MQKKGMTLIEILVASMIFALIVSGLAGIFMMARGHNVHSRSRLIASQLEKSFLDPLNLEVDQGNWDSNCLGANNCLNPVHNIDGRDYTAAYDISDVSDTDLKRATITITWNED